MAKELNTATCESSATTPGFNPGHSSDDRQLWTNWISLWNGDYSLGSAVVGPKLSLHASLLGGQDPRAFNTPEAMVSLIAQIRTAVPDLVFDVKVGPIIADGHIVGHWNASGHYAGQYPGATAAVGTEISFNGTDILRIEDKRVAEYWLVADTLGLLTQLGMLK